VRATPNLPVDRSEVRERPDPVGRLAPTLLCQAEMEPSDDAQPMPLSTGLEIPGMVVREGLGVVFGLVVRSLGLSGSVTASFKALRRGEISEYTTLLEDSRRHAIDRMIENARLVGADAIVSMRFDSSEIGQQFTEIVAYGTAVRLERAS
jgi:uncharacterized protein YbjQ (UPF0145 family)